MPGNDGVGFTSFHPDHKPLKADGTLNVKTHGDDANCCVPHTIGQGRFSSTSDGFTNQCGSLHNCSGPFSMKRPKVDAIRDSLPLSSSLAANIIKVGSEVGRNVESMEPSDATSSAAAIPSNLLRSVNSEPVESLDSRSRAGENESKKTLCHVNFDASFAIKRQKMHATRDFRPSCGALALHIDEVGAEVGLNVESSKHSSARNCAVATQTWPSRSLDSRPVEFLDSWSRGYEIESKKTANHIISPQMTWKEGKEMVSMFAPLTQAEDHALVQPSNPSNSPVVDSWEESIYGQSANEVVSLSVVPHVNEAARNKVITALKDFERLYTELLNEDKGTRRVDVEAAECLRRKGKWICSEKQLGHIQGIAIGDRFQFRAELAVVGLHCQYVSGIDFLSLNGRKFATSIVNSGCYENRYKSLDVLVYSGQGGNPQFGTCKSDQELKRGNLALRNSMELGYPVRIIRKSKSLKASTSLHMNGDGGLAHKYEYNGLYKVKRFWQERDRDRRLVFKFELHRIMSQPLLSLRTVKGSKKSAVCKEHCVVEDVSQGKEKIPIRALNGVDDEKPQPFTYITNITYPDWCKNSKHSGCNCTNGCSNLRQCLCVLKNGGKIPFSERGTILGQKDIVYECGPSCECPPSCMNRVSQHGSRYRLEVFKTKLQRWGVRSRSYISSGGFVCEYIGALLPIKNSRRRFDHGQIGSMYAGSESLFIVDPMKFGNVGRFISHSNTPNLDVRYILYDHDDKRMPHVMLFAAKNIPPLRELTCDYNHVGMKLTNGKFV